MARGGTESASPAIRGRPSPTTRDDGSGLIGRILRKRFAGGNAHRENQHKPAVTSAAAAPHQSNTTPTPARQPEPAPATPTPAPTPALGLIMPSATPPPQPQLKKKASLRDRLKTWQKPAPQPLEMVAEELKPRFVYKPTHAAADFSQIAVSPSHTAWHGLASPLSGDDGVPARRPSQTRARDGDRATRRDERAAKRQNSNAAARSEAKRHSRTMPAEDPFPAVTTTPQTAPITTQPPSPARVPTAAAPRRPAAQEAPSQPLSDYELFIARAEADDRHRREQMRQLLLRSMSQHAATTHEVVKPDPHQQFAATGSSSSAERRRHAAEQQPHKPRQRGHTRHASWAPSSSTAGGSSSGRAPQQQKTLDSQVHAPRELVVANGADEIYDTNYREYQPAPPRTLRRQASLSKRIADYIRPPKAGMRAVETLVE